MRKLISIRIDPKIYETAREMGLNISKTCENSLKQATQRLTTSDCSTNCTTTLIASTQPSRFIDQNGLQDTSGEPGSPRANSANAKAGNPVGSRHHETTYGSSLESTHKSPQKACDLSRSRGFKSHPRRHLTYAF